MTDLLAPPPWKVATVNGFKYKSTVSEGLFLEALSIIACRLNDLNETFKDNNQQIADLIAEIKRLG